MTPGPGPSPTGPAGPGPTGPAGPGPTGPAGPAPTNRVDRELLGDIDSALIGLLALAYFSPTVRNTSASVRQVCAAEVLLHRLRASRLAVRELAVAYGIETPVRRDFAEASPRASAVATTGGPVMPPQVRGEEPAPGSAIAARSGVVRESVGACGEPRAGDSSGRGGDVDLPSRPVFLLPRPYGPPSFAVGTGPLYDALPHKT